MKSQLKFCFARLKKIQSPQLAKSMQHYNFRAKVIFKNFFVLPFLKLFTT